MTEKLNSTPVMTSETYKLIFLPLAKIGDSLDLWKMQKVDYWTM